MAIRVLVHEWVTGGGLVGRDCPPSWASEGGAIRRALAGDFQSLDGVEVVATLDPRFREGQTPWEEVDVRSQGEVEALARGCQFTLLVAPETGGVLADLTDRLDAIGVRTLGAPAEAVRLAADKHRLATRLREAGVATPPTTLVRPREGLPSDHPYPAVLKPVDGAGSFATFRVDRPEAWAAPEGLPETMLLQPYVRGEPLSASFLVDGRGFARLLAVGRQSVRESSDGAFTYEGGRLPFPTEWAGGATRQAVRVVEGLRGYVGVDFLRDRETGAMTVLEINPRPTTSVVGLVAALGPAKLASAWLDALGAGNDSDDLGGMLRPGRDRTVAFLADGTLATPETPTRGTLALDVGGANVKAAHSDGPTRAVPFALWRRPEALPDVLRDLAGTLPGFDRVLLTTTAELCDCFATKRDGVRSVVEAVASAFPGPRLAVWGTDGRFRSAAAARADPLPCAAANWQALATAAARLAGSGTGLLVDVGSTTTDLIPFRNGRVAARGRTDTERLQNGELVYAGVRRTPVCALADRLPYRGRPTRLMAELFATTLDVFLTTGDLPDAPDDLDTADGRPATADAARDRLARLVGADRESFEPQDASALAETAAGVMLDRLSEAAAEALTGAGHEAVETVVIAGSGEFLAARLADRLPGVRRRVKLSELWGGAESVAACARALLDLDPGRGA